MEKFKEFLYTLLGIIIACAVFFGIWKCSSSDAWDRVSVIPVPETELTIVKSDRNYVGSDDAAVISYFYLMNKEDTLAWKCCDFNPFINLKGVVYIPEKGLYDCRGGQVVEILALKEVPDLNMNAVDESKKLLIIVGSPFWNLQEMSWDNSKVKQYVYDLGTRELSE